MRASISQNVLLFLSEDNSDDNNVKSVRTAYSITNLIIEILYNIENKLILNEL